MPRRQSSPSSARTSSVLASLTLAERGEVLDGLLAAHPELGGEAEHLAGDLLSSTSADEVAAQVVSALGSISLDDLASRVGRVRGRGYVHETDAAWESVEEVLAPFRSDLERRIAGGVGGTAASVAVGIAAGLYQVREPEMGSVLNYAGEDAPSELAADVLDLAAKLGVDIPADAAHTYWPSWDGLR